LSESDETALLDALSSDIANRVLALLIEKGDMSAGQLQIQAIAVAEDCAKNLRLLEKAGAIAFVNGKWRVTDRGKEVWEKYFA